MPVDDAGGMSLAQGLLGERCAVSLLGYAVEDRAEEYVVAVLLVAAHFLQRVAGVQGVVVHHYPVAKAWFYLSNEGVLLLSRGLRLAQVQRGEAVAEEAVDDFRFAAEKLGLSEQYQLHIAGAFYKLRKP